LSHEILLKQLDLGTQERSFVVVGVVRTDGPTAIKTGNKAIILDDGSIEGWVGGHCTESEIVTNALDCLNKGTSRMLNLTTCQGGRMDVYLEPYLPKRKMIIFGHVPIVGALAHLAKALNFNVTIIDRTATKQKFPDSDAVFASPDEFVQSNKISAQTYAVVATMGERDQEYVQLLSRLGVSYIGVVAGKKRASEIISYLRANDLSEEQLAKIRAPAGIYIRAVTSEEIALSIMAEVVELGRLRSDELVRNSQVGLIRTGGNEKPRTSDTQSGAGKVFVDPVCGMTVDSSSKFHSRLENGQILYFCCESCKNSFDSDPNKFLVPQEHPSPT
jgi:xanthine dehydrogenase accessory factor